MSIKKILTTIIVIFIILLVYLYISNQKRLTSESSLPIPTPAPIESIHGNNQSSIQIIINPQDIHIPPTLPLLKIETISLEQFAQSLSRQLHLSPHSSVENMWQSQDSLETITISPVEKTLNYSYFDPQPKTIIPNSNITKNILNQFLNRAALSDILKIGNHTEYFSDDFELLPTSPQTAKIIKHTLEPNYPYPIVEADQSLETNHALVDSRHVIKLVIARPILKVHPTSKLQLKSPQDLELDLLSAKGIITKIKNYHSYQPINSSNIKKLTVTSQQIHYRFNTNQEYAYPYIALIGTSTIDQQDYQIELALSLTK